jgi:hyperosmotically inducible protein
MNAQASRKLIVVGAMAAVVAIGVITFAMRPHNFSRIAPASTPPTSFAESTVAADAVAPVPETQSAVAPVAPVEAVSATPVRDAAPARAATPARAAAPAHKDVAVIKRATVRKPDSTVKSAVEPKLAAEGNVPTANTDVLAGADTTKPTNVAPDLGMQSAAAAVANSSEPAQNAAATTAMPAPGMSSMPAPAVAADQTPAGGATLTAGDGEITANVKTAIAADSLGKSASIGVNTTNGVVALTGTLTSQDAIDHIKLVATGIKDVKSVDTSGLVVPAN